MDLSGTNALYVAGAGALVFLIAMHPLYLCCRKRLVTTEGEFGPAGSYREGLEKSRRIKAKKQRDIEANGEIDAIENGNIPGFTIKSEQVDIELGLATTSAMTGQPAEPEPEPAQAQAVGCNAKQESEPASCVIDGQVGQHDGKDMASLVPIQLPDKKQSTGNLYPSTSTEGSRRASVTWARPIEGSRRAAHPKPKVKKNDTISTRKSQSSEVKKMISPEKTRSPENCNADDDSLYMGEAPFGTSQSTPGLGKGRAKGRRQKKALRSSVRM